MRSKLPLIGIALGAVVLVAAGVFIGQRLSPGVAAPAATPSSEPSPDPTSTPNPSAAETAAPTVPDGFVTFSDPETGVQIAYPEDWDRFEVPDDEQVRLLASPNGRDSFLVRVVDLDVEVDADDGALMRAVADGIVTADESVELLAEPRQIDLAGLPGLFYFYSFEDEETGDRGAHSHYFLFRGETLFTLVFQALPADGFPELAPVFDQIAGTLRIAS